VKGEEDQKLKKSEIKTGQMRVVAATKERIMSPQRKLLLLGTFVHSKTQQHLEFLHNAGVAVDEQGKIAVIERDVADVSEAKERLVKRLGWNEAEVDVTVAAEGQFFFPGFVGEFGYHRPDDEDDVQVITDYLYQRHAHPRPPVRKRRHLWQIKSP
jgi:hypothetical protein